MPMKEEPMTTMFFFEPSAAARMDWTSVTVRRVKILERSRKPGRGRVRGTPPVARTRLV
jgi:hypothetical protein